MSLSSTTYDLPNDLLINHYSHYQTRITSQTVTDAMMTKINQVKHHLHSFNHTEHAFGRNNVDSGSYADENEQLKQLTREVELLDINSTAITPMSKDRETLLLSRYHESHIAHLLNKPLSEQRALPQYILNDETKEDDNNKDITVVNTSNNNESNSNPTKSFTLGRQIKLNRCITAINAIGEAKNIVVVAGAGISVSSGIPDFRSENGLYSLLRGVNLGDDDFDPNDLFEINYFKSNPVPFYTFYYKMGLCSDIVQPSFMHHFLKLLQDKNRLQRVYTQNIDNLEILAGLNEDKLVTCHGNDTYFYCVQCKLTLSKTDPILQELFLLNHQIPYCHAIRQAIQTRKNNDIKTYQTLLNFNRANPQFKGCKGVWKPKITFFGESLPEHFFTSWQQDVGKSDLIIVVGSSLQVNPVNTIPNAFSSNRGKANSAVTAALGKTRSPSKFHANISDIDAVLMEFPRKSHLDNLIKNLQHVPIITINRDSLFTAPYPQRRKEVSLFPPSSSDDDNDDDDDFSDGDYDSWCSHNDESVTKSRPIIQKAGPSSLKHCEFEFLGDANCVAQFIVKALGW